MIFETLQEKKIPYAVVVGTTKLLSTSDVSIKNYCLIGAQRDWATLINIGFVELSGSISHKAILEYELDEVEIVEFKDMIHKEVFEKVFHDRDGRIYNKKGEDFKSYALEFFS